MICRRLESHIGFAMSAVMDGLERLIYFFRKEEKGGAMLYLETCKGK